eukprot:7703497-Heterocapsa_arctica.AAC.1
MKNQQSIHTGFNLYLRASLIPPAFAECPTQQCSCAFSLLHRSPIMLHNQLLVQLSSSSHPY